MRKLRRRTFLKGAACGLGLAATRVVSPKMLFAQAASGKGRNIILVNLRGGSDGLALFPWYQGEIGEYIRNSLRPAIAVDPAIVIPRTAQHGANHRGLHPLFSKVAAEAGSNISLIQQIGIPIYPGGAHDQCESIYSIGEASAPVGSSKGWLARLMDGAHMSSYQVWGIGSDNRIDFRTQEDRPVVIRSLNSYAPLRREFGTVNYCTTGTSSSCQSDYVEDSRYSRLIRNRLIEVQKITNPVDRAFQATSRAVEPSVALISTIASHPLVGDYHRGVANELSQSSFGAQCADCAKILVSSATDPIRISQSRIVYLNLMGFDTHASQSSSLSSLLDNVSSSLRGLIQDLKAGGVWNDTVIYLFSEFGRRNYQNGGLGTDHAYSNTHMVLGGSIVNGLFGDDPLMSELRDTSSKGGILSVSVDFRRPLIEMLQWAGMSTEGLFNEQHDSRPLGLFV